MFEKIYFTILIIQVVVSIIYSMFIQKFDLEIIEYIIGYLWLIQLAFIIGYLVVKFIGLIWGFNIDLFPNIGFVQRG